MVTISSSKLLGTSKETMRSVTAKANTASLKASMRNISWPRMRNVAFLFSKFLETIFLSMAVLLDYFENIKSLVKKQLLIKIILIEWIFVFHHQLLKWVFN